MAKKKSVTETPAQEPRPSEYTVLARRYRPQQFADLVGQEPVAQALSNALQTGRVAHAYLFTGARGVGKTSMARILAKALNCQKGPSIKPCGECEMCKAVTSGDDIDVLEIDGASNRGIDEVREIRQNVQFRPSRARYKIYIIDEVHMLTGPAFNALLKTLEEPPPHVKFIFATTEVQKIPITILSRCQRFDFAGIGTSMIVDRLREIVVSEGMQADDEALELVARRAGGSMRDAQSLLDQLLAFGSERLTTEQVHALLGTANEDRIAALADAALGGDAKRALELLDDAVNQGLQLGELLDQLLEYWRDLMVVNCAGADKQALSVSGKLRGALAQQAQQHSADTILAGLDVLVSAKNRLHNISQGRVLFEMALVRLSRLGNLVSVSQLAQWLGKEGAAPAKPGPSAGPQAGPGPGIGRTESPSISEKKKIAEVADEPSVSIPLSEDSLSRIWEQLLAKVGLIFSGELRKCSSVAIFGPNSLVIRFPAGYTLQNDHYLASADRLKRLEEALSGIVGQPCTIRVEVAATNGQASAPTTAERGETATARSRRLRAEIAQVPLVGKAIERLGGQIVQMDDEFGAIAATESTAEDIPEEE